MVTLLRFIYTNRNLLVGNWLPTTAEGYDNLFFSYQCVHLWLSQFRENDEWDLVGTCKKYSFLFSEMIDSDWLPYSKSVLIASITVPLQKKKMFFVFTQPVWGSGETRFKAVLKFENPVFVLKNSIWWLKHIGYVGKSGIGTDLKSR